VGGEEDGLAELTEPGHDLPGGAAGGRVEAGGGLVEEDEVGIADEGKREVEPSPLAAGEPGGDRVRSGFEADQFDGLVDVPRRAVEPGVQGQAFAHGQAKLGLRFLQDHAHPVAPGAARRGRILPQDGDLAIGPRPEALEDFHRRGLARAVRAEEGEDLPAPHLEIDARDGLLTAVPLDQAADADDRLGLGRGGGRVACGTFLADAVHRALRLRSVLASSLLGSGRVGLRRGGGSYRRATLNHGWPRLHPRVEVGRPRIHPMGADGQRIPPYRLGMDMRGRGRGRRI
jgi:hypothetical protein